MHRVRFVLAVTMLVAVVSLAAGAQAASSFAAPQFQQQWQQGEGLTPNFWGPLETAKNGQMEPYQEAGGQRLVQYFDKGRMELTNGAVTNGLLATEIVRGKIQVGDNSFQNQTPPNISIAGDADNPAPTYAGLAGAGAPLLGPASSTPGAAVSAAIGANGSLGSVPGGSDAATVIGAFDDATKHNVAQAFVDYRNKAGLATIGFGISEPFMANVKVGGSAKQVMVQVFERRVLTYTASNPDAFKVEMGNIGQHYYLWRYPNGTAPAAAAPPANTANPTAPGPPKPQVNIKGGLAFVTPDGWQVDKSQAASTTGLTLVGPAPTLKFVVQQYDQSTPPTTLDGELATYIASAHKLAAGSIKDEATRDTAIGGEAAKAYRFSGTRTDGSAVSGIVAVVFHNGRVFSFVALADASPLPNYDDVNYMLATVTFE